jgi:hypothetical protein
MLIKLFLIRVSHAAVHLKTDENGISHCPGRGVGLQQAELERQALAMGVDEVVDAAGVGSDGSAVGRGQSGRMHGREPPHAQAARFEVTFQPAPSYQFGQLARR